MQKENSNIQEIAFQILPPPLNIQLEFQIQFI